MFHKKLIGAAMAIALASSSTVAVAARTIAPLPASEAVDADSALRRTGILVPLALIAALSVILYLLVLKGDDKEEPITP